MKKNSVVTGMLALALVFGLMMTGCDNGSTSSSGGEAKSITITGLSSYNGEDIGIALYATPPAGDGSTVPSAVGMAAVAGGSATAELLTYMGAIWTGSGSFYIGIAFDPSTDEYGYTGGSGTVLVKFTISAAASAIDLSKFIAANQITG